MAPQIARSTEEYAEALQAALDTKQTRDELYSALYMEVCSSSDKKPSEAYIKQAIMADRNYRAACRLYIAAEGQKSRIGGDLEALRTKRDMLVSLGAHVRIELQTHGGGTRDAEDQEEEEDEDYDLDED